MQISIKRCSIIFLLAFLSLLSLIIARSSTRYRPAEDFRPHLEGLNRLIGWIEQHQTVEFISDYCDPNTNQCYGKPLRGWASPHLTTQTTPLAWSTAQVLSCTMRMRKVVQRLLHVDVLEEFGGITNKGVPNLASWDRLLDTDLGDPGNDHRTYRTLKDVLEERMIQPFLKIDERCNLPQFGAAYSSILFGPPGTAKSKKTHSLAGMPLSTSYHLTLSHCFYF